ncbi:hypothetical protein IFT48_05095 [Pseudomonas fluorescens]|nr:hypothetical protein [Pseudomonas fluorescens]MBD8615221.1 hypothetical protein [Pseudomonas putida]MBD8682125.1 hypothetical protein [Pseudomonas sp. CFBP 13719]
MVSVNIDGLPAVNFYQSGAAEFGMNQDVSSLLRRLSPECVITLMGMRDCEEWQIMLNDEQTLARMEEIFREAGMPGCMDTVRAHKANHTQELSLTQFWKQVLQPLIAGHAVSTGEDQSPSFKSVMSKAHPANSRRKLHPKAGSFLEQEFPRQVEKHLKMEAGGIVKTA